MHAKKTRDRKKQFLEVSEKVISEMEAEALAMRQYLRSLNLISEQEMAEYIERDNRSKRAIEQMKLVRLCCPSCWPRRSDRVALSRVLSAGIGWRSGRRRGRRR
jgi:SOS-response transcriptional repressor LexA